MCPSFIQRSLDYETQFTYAYSKIVGLQAGGTYELKKDYITMVKNQQMYVIPAGREINELLWFSRSNLSDSMMAPFTAGAGMAGFSGLGQIGINGSYFMMPAFDLILRMGDRNLKNRLTIGDLTYRITAGPNGTKIIHLHNVPGGRYDFGSIKSYEKVWYWYYETNGDRDDCLTQNQDIIRLPSDVAVEGMSWTKLNKPSQNWVRKMFITYCKEALARVWGKYSGDIQVPDSTIKLDYQSLMTEAKDERMKLWEELSKRLERLLPEKQLELKANQAESLNKSLKFRAIMFDMKTLIFLSF